MNNEDVSPGTVYRVKKRPVEIQAMRIDSEKDLKTAESKMGLSYAQYKSTGYDFSICSPEGWVDKPWGHFLMKGVRGEFYICANDIFLETYELAGDE